MNEASSRLATLAFFATVLFGAGIFWLAPYPPMTDLPQHAAQLVMLKSILTGTSPWADFFQLNPFTPFLLSTSLVLPLSYLLPVIAAFKLVLSLAYIAFVTVCVKLGREFGADRRLDWVYLIGFFGLSFHWGFVNFLVTAPLGLYFILLATRYARQQTGSAALKLTLAGLLMLISHGLIFVYGWSVGFLILVTSDTAPRRLPRLVLPYLGLGIAAVGLLLLGKHANQGVESFVTATFKLDWRLARLRDVLLFTVESGRLKTDLVFFGAVLLIGALAPWLLGLRIDWRHRASLACLTVAGAIAIAMPSVAFNTYFLYHRFALFLPSVYAFLFTAQSDRRPWLPSQVVTLLLVLASWGVLGRTALHASLFAEETKDFDVVMAALEPGQRALSIVLDRESKAADSDVMYLHFPAWYQAQSGGLVEFNFAWFPPQIVRYRPHRLPAATPTFPWRPETFSWDRQQAGLYRYFFVRSKTPVRADFFAGAPCEPVLIADSGEWTVYERQPCPQSEQTSD